MEEAAEKKYSDHGLTGLGLEQIAIEIDRLLDSGSAWASSGEGSGNHLEVLGEVLRSKKE